MLESFQNWPLEPKEKYEEVQAVQWERTESSIRQGLIIIIILKMKAISVLTVSNSHQNSNIQQKISKKSRQELIVQINIGKHRQTKELYLSDINNMSYIDSQIKFFIKECGIKETAFGYIKEIIMKQISHRKEQIYRQCHQKCSKNCKCQNKMEDFQMKEKKILGVISLTTNPKTSESRSLQAKTKVNPQHLSIIITPNPAYEVRDEVSPLPSIKKSQTIPLSTVQKQHCPSLNSIKSKDITLQSKIQQQTSSYNSFQDYFFIKNPEAIGPEQASFSQNRHLKMKFSSKENDIKQSLSSQKKCKIISTRERKEAIMTPQKMKLKQSSSSTILLSAHLSQVNEWKRNLTEKNCIIIQKILQSPLFPDSCIPQGFQGIINSLFMKLTEQNPPGVNELHSQFVCYQRLQRLELQLMGILFQKINHKDLNYLNYDNFRSNTLKYCWKELQQLVKWQSSCHI